MNLQDSVPFHVVFFGEKTTKRQWFQRLLYLISEGWKMLITAFWYILKYPESDPSSNIFFTQKLPAIFLCGGFSGPSRGPKSWSEWWRWNVSSYVSVPCCRQVATPTALVRKMVGANNQWIGWRENIQETTVSPMKYREVLRFSFPPPSQIASKEWWWRGQVNNWPMLSHAKLSMSIVGRCSKGLFLVVPDAIWCHNVGRAMIDQVVNRD